MTFPLPGEPERLTDGVTWGQLDCEHSEWVDGPGPGGGVRQTCVDCGETYLGYTPAQLDSIGEDQR